MTTRERDMVLLNGEAYPAPPWLADIIREQRREERRKLTRPHEEHSRRHWSEIEDGRTD